MASEGTSEGSVVVDHWAGVQQVPLPTPVLTAPAWGGHSSDKGPEHTGEEAEARRWQAPRQRPRQLDPTHALGCPVLGPEGSPLGAPRRGTSSLSRVCPGRADAAEKAQGGLADVVTSGSRPATAALGRGLWAPQVVLRERRELLGWGRGDEGQVRLAWALLKE